MSGQVFDVGSVVEFYPRPFQITVADQEGRQSRPVDAYGWGIIVTKRDGWSITTGVEPMIICPRHHGGLVPVQSHWVDAHGFNPEWEAYSSGRRREGKSVD